MIERSNPLTAEYLASLPELVRDRLTRALPLTGTWVDYGEDTSDLPSLLNQGGYGAWIQPNGNIYFLGGRERHETAALTALGFHVRLSQGQALEAGNISVSLVADDGVATIITGGNPISGEQRDSLQSMIATQKSFLLIHGEHYRAEFNIAELESQLNIISDSSTIIPPTQNLAANDISTSTSLECMFEVVTDPRGLHSRPCAEIMNLVKKSGCEVTVTDEVNNRSANGKSIMELLLLCSDLGATLKFQIAGDNPRLLLQQLCDLHFLDLK